MENKVTKYQFRKDGFKPSYRRNNGFYCEYIVVSPKLEQVITCKLYQPVDTAYACLWVHMADYPSGTGKAGGYGYDKASAAVQEAYTAAGYQLQRSIDGAGEEAIIGALLAIAEYHGLAGCKVFKAHE